MILVIIKSICSPLKFNCLNLQWSHAVEGVGCARVCVQFQKNIIVLNGIIDL